ncbi:unnamed protein product [Brachionus calyciflorus]|uniref:Uncharacterized protein n=1 Tax=Brachionus calyciflorus TaxID=104777 RepID=A0A813N714_9BILA|nr:unnamed protein product [Brachionus calyciflorus]
MEKNENVVKQNISSYDKDENVKKESSYQDTDEETGSDDENKENVEYNATASRSGELVQLLARDNLWFQKTALYVNVIRSVKEEMSACQ